MPYMCVTSPAPRLSRPGLNFTGESKWTLLFLFLLLFLLLWDLDMLCLLSLWMSTYRSSFITSERSISARLTELLCLQSVELFLQSVPSVTACLFCGIKTRWNNSALSLFDSIKDRPRCFCSPSFSRRSSFVAVLAKWLSVVWCRSDPQRTDDNPFRRICR